MNDIIPPHNPDYPVSCGPTLLEAQQRAFSGVRVLDSGDASRTSETARTATSRRCVPPEHRPSFYNATTTVPRAIMCESNERYRSNLCRRSVLCPATGSHRNSTRKPVGTPPLLLSSFQTHLTFRSDDVSVILD